MGQCDIWGSNSRVVEDSGLLICDGLPGWVVPDLSKDQGALITMGQAVLEMNASWTHKMSQTTHPTQHHTPDDLNPQIWGSLFTLITAAPTAVLHPYTCIFDNASTFNCTPRMFSKCQPVLRSCHQNSYYILQPNHLTHFSHVTTNTHASTGSPHWTLSQKQCWFILTLTNFWYPKIQ